MKFQKLIALTMLFVMAGTSFIQAKGFCPKNLEWRKGKCRKKKKDKSDKQNIVQQTFEPAKDFAGTGFIGKYNEKKNKAKIIDPSDDNAVIYKFNDVITVEGFNETEIVPSSGQVKIGSYMVPNRCAPGKMCTAVMKNITLFGSLNEKFDTKRNARNEAIIAKIESQTPSINNGVAAPNLGNHTAIMYQIDNNTDQDVEITFLPETVPSNVRMIPQKEIVKAHESVLIPKGINRIMLQQTTQQTIELTPFKSYSLVQNEEGNVSLKVQQIYY